MKLIMEFKDIYPISTNEMYAPTYNHKKKYSFLRKSDTLIEFQNNMASRLLEYSDAISQFIELCKSKYTYLGFKLTIWLGMNDMFLKTSNNLRAYDASNYLKAIEDCISTVTGIDDRYDMEVRVIKYHTPDLETWYTIAQLEPVDYMIYKSENIQLDVPTQFGIIKEEESND